MFSSGPKYQKLTTNLRLTINRLKLLEKKKTELAVKSRREIADYLAAGKEERARIRVEHIIREDYLVEAMEMIEMYCDLLLARMGLIQTTKELEDGLVEPIASVIWATPRLQAECQEMKIVSEQFAAKYGKEFAEASKSNKLNQVNEKLIHKLAVQAPPRLLVEKYLEEIAKTYNVPYEPDPGPVEVDEPLQADGMLIDFGETPGNKSGGGGLTPLQPNMYPPNQRNDAPPLPTVPPAAPYQPPHQAPPFTMPTPPSGYNQPPAPVNQGMKAPPPAAKGGLPDLPDLPSVPSNSFHAPPAGGSSAGGEDVDFDDLTRRFEELKKRK